METIDVTILHPEDKHPSILNKFDLLESGESLVIENDHDPKPLYYQMVGLKGEVFNWDYLEDGPDSWKVKITRLNDGEKPSTIAEVALSDTRKVEVFKKYGLDFCCGGKRTISEACRKKGVDIVEVEKELRKIENDSLNNEEDCNCWDLDILADYIVKKHHEYVKNSVIQIGQFLSKITTVHGENHPQLHEIQFQFNQVAQDLEAHMDKEEMILFPYIKELQKSKNDNSELDRPMFGTIRNPIQMMEQEHVDAGNSLETINRLTDKFTPPEGACNSFRITYQYLKEFEGDLHRHIHLENNVLFPKAIKLEEELFNR